MENDDKFFNKVVVVVFNLRVDCFNLWKVLIDVTNLMTTKVNVNYSRDRFTDRLIDFKNLSTFGTSYF